MIFDVLVIFDHFEHPRSQHRTPRCIAVEPVFQATVFEHQIHVIYSRTNGKTPDVNSRCSNSLSRQSSQYQIFWSQLIYKSQISGGCMYPYKRCTFPSIPIKDWRHITGEIPPKITKDFAKCGDSKKVGVILNYLTLMRSPPYSIAGYSTLRSYARL